MCCLAQRDPDSLDLSRSINPVFTLIIHLVLKRDLYGVRASKVSCHASSIRRNGKLIVGYSE